MVTETVSPSRYWIKHNAFLFVASFLRKMIWNKNTQQWRLKIRRHIYSMLECTPNKSQIYRLLCSVSRTWINAYGACSIVMYLNLFKDSLISWCRFTIHKCVLTYPKPVNMSTKIDRMALICKSCKHTLSSKKGSSDKTIIQASF